MISETDTSEFKFGERYPVQLYPQDVVADARYLGELSLGDLGRSRFIFSSIENGEKHYYLLDSSFMVRDGELITYAGDSREEVFHCSRRWLEGVVYGGPLGIIDIFEENLEKLDYGKNTKT